MYTCGPTVYRPVHLGNLRSYLLADWLRRAFEVEGYRVVHVKNITDVGHMRQEVVDRGEDKVIAAALAEGKTPMEIAATYEARFHDDERALGILPATVFPRATEHVTEMVALIERLVARGLAYVVDGTVYYAVKRFPGYGRLSGNVQEALRQGVRAEIDPAKHDPADFALWKRAERGRLALVWPSPWGDGYPGWHIECSAMSMRYLGERFDIHTGGVDNIFPHHEAEIAQSEGVTGHRVVSVWMHGGHLFLGAARMAKSAGNFFRITDLVDQGFDPLALRYLALQAKYRTKLSFAIDVLAGADRALRQLRRRVAEWRRAEDGPRGDYEERFRAAIADDLDLPAAMALVAELVRSDLAPGAKAGLLGDWDRVLGLDLLRAPEDEPLPDGAAELLAARERARAARDYAESDRLRDALTAIGVRVTDTPEGQRWSVGPTG